MIILQRQCKIKKLFLNAKKKIKVQTNYSHLIKNIKYFFIIVWSLMESRLENNAAPLCFWFFHTWYLKKKFQPTTFILSYVKLMIMY